MLDQPTKIQATEMHGIASPLADYQQAKLVLVGDRRTKNAEPKVLDFVQSGNIYQAATQGKFIPEEVDPTVQKRLEQMHIPEQTAHEVLSEINRFGQDPESTLKALMQNNRVLAIGESHQSPNPQRDLGAQAMADLKAAGATHLAIEAPMYVQPALDEYMRTGRLDPKVLPPLLRDEDYMNMLEAARKNGLKIVAVDANQKYGEASDGGRNGGPREQRESGPPLNRDRIMADNVSKILDQDPNNKVVFWVGSQHLNRSENPNFKTAADYLKEKTGTATAAPIYPNDRGAAIWPLPEITTHLQRPVAVPTDKAKTLGSLPESTYNDINPEFMRDWDYVFIYPNIRH